jgi:hypothetical protein
MSVIPSSASSITSASYPVSATIGLNDGGSSAMTMEMLLLESTEGTDSPVGSFGAIGGGVETGPHEARTSVRMTAKVRKSNVRDLVNIRPPEIFGVGNSVELLHELTLLLRFLPDEFRRQR